MLWVLLGIAVLALASAIVPRWARIFLPRQSRIPGAPTRTLDTWAVQAVSVAIVAGIAVYAVRALWPDESQRDLVGSAAALVLGVALSIWVLASIVARRDRENLERARAAAEPATAPPLAPGRLFEYASLAVALLTVLIAGVAFAGVADDDGAVRADPEPTPTELLDPADELLKDFSTLHFPLDVLDAAPETGNVIDTWWYAAVDVDAELPHQAWHQSEPPAPYTAADVLENSELLLRVPGFHCSAVAIVAIETETTVTVGIAVSQSPPTPAPTETVGPDGIPTPLPTSTNRPLDMTCVAISGIRNDWFPVNLAAPLGDRQVINYGGRPLAQYREPIDYGSLNDD